MPIDVSALTPEQAQDMLSKLMAENAMLKSKAQNRHALTISPSKHGTGTLCVYGMGRYPVSLYGNQWRKLAAIMPEIIATLDANPQMFPDKS